MLIINAIKPVTGESTIHRMLISSENADKIAKKNADKRNLEPAVDRSLD